MGRVGAMTLQKILDSVKIGDLLADTLANLNAKVSDGTLVDSPVSVEEGAISIWHDTIGNIPAGYVICDGNNSTPNLLAKFVKGVATAGTNPGAVGGAATHSLAISEMPAHTHPGNYNSASAGVPSTPSALKGPGETKAVAVISQGGDGAHENEPPFFDGAFLMKT